MPYHKSYKPYRRNYSSNKKKWSPIYKDVTPTQIAISAGQINGSFFTVASNSSENAVASPVPTVIKIKHIKCAMDFKTDSTNLSNGFCCFLYCPQGITASSAVVLAHPEWMLAWRSIPNNVAASHQTIMLNSSLSRNLNSGDSLVCFFSFLNYGGGDVLVSVTGRATAVVRNN